MRNNHCIRIPGVAARTLLDAYAESPNETALTYRTKAKLKAGIRRRQGKGWLLVVELDRAELDELGMYVDSVVGMLETMTTEEQGDGGKELRAMRTLLTRIDDAS